MEKRRTLEEKEQEEWVKHIFFLKGQTVPVTCQISNPQITLIKQDFLLSWLQEHTKRGKKLVSPAFAQWRLQFFVTVSTAVLQMLRPSDCPELFTPHSAAVWPLLSSQIETEEDAQEGSEAALGRQTLVSEEAGRDDGQRLANLQRGLQHHHQGRQDPQPHQELEGVFSAGTHPGGHRQMWLQGELFLL